MSQITPDTTVRFLFHKMKRLGKVFICFRIFIRRYIKKTLDLSLKYEMLNLIYYIYNGAWFLKMESRPRAFKRTIGKKIYACCLEVERRAI